MNKQRRERVKIAAAHLEKALNIIDDVQDEEETCLDNIPENLQGGDRYESIEFAIDKLSSALDNMSEASIQLGYITE